jgi:hypothetical protein
MGYTKNKRYIISYIERFPYLIGDRAAGCFERYLHGNGQDFSQYFLGFLSYNSYGLAVRVSVNKGLSVLV